MTLHSHPKKGQSFEFGDDYASSSKLARKICKYLEKQEAKHFKKVAKMKAALAPGHQRRGLCLMDDYLMYFLMDAISEWESAAIRYAKLENELNKGSRALRTHFPKLMLENNFFYYANPRLCSQEKRNGEEKQ